MNPGVSKEKTKLRLLLIEDNEDDEILLLRALSKDFTVQFQRVNNSSHLTQKLVAETWDVVISDYNMPGFSAQEALRIVRDTQPRLPFLLVSGITSIEGAVSLIKEGANDFVAKNNFDRLVPVIKNEMELACKPAT